MGGDGVIWGVLSLLAIAAAAMLVTAKVYQFALAKEAARENAADEWRAFRVGLFIIAVFIFAAASLVIHDKAAAAGLPPRCAKLLPLMKDAYRGHPIAAGVLAGQIYQESSCRADAISHAGARGLAQFTPPTDREMTNRYGIVCNWKDPACALRKQTAYMGQLFNTKVARQMRDLCARLATALSSYNGGYGWTIRDWKRTKAEGGDHRQYFAADDGIQNYNDQRRADWAIDENNKYAGYIFWRQLAFIAAGMKGDCA